MQYMHKWNGFIYNTITFFFIKHTVTNNSRMKHESIYVGKLSLDYDSYTEKI